MDCGCKVHRFKIISKIILRYLFIQNTLEDYDDIEIDYVMIRSVCHYWKKLADSMFKFKNKFSLHKSIRSMKYNGVVFLLDNHQYMIDFVDICFALECAVSNGNLLFFKELYRKYYIDPSVNDNICLKMACSKGHQDIVEILIKDTRVNPSCSVNILCFFLHDVFIYFFFLG